MEGWSGAWLCRRGVGRIQRAHPGPWDGDKLGVSEKSARWKARVQSSRLWKGGQWNLDLVCKAGIGTSLKNPTRVNLGQGRRNYSSPFSEEQGLGVGVLGGS